MALTLKDIKTTLNTSNQPKPTSTDGSITTTISVETVTGEERLNKNNKSYTMLNIIYRNDKGQLKEKKFPAFTDFGKQAVQVLEEGSDFEVTMKKGEEGFWNWTSITRA